MASWGEFARAAPELAQLGIERLSYLPPALAYLATVQADGSPQVHPVCPVIAGEHLYVAIGHRSPKLRDLRENGRYMLHCMPGKNDEEFSVRGRATEANDDTTRAAFLEAGAAIGLNTKDEEIVVRFDIERADVAYWENVGQPDTRPVRRKWVVNG